MIENNRAKDWNVQYSPTGFYNTPQATIQKADRSEFTSEDLEYLRKSFEEVLRVSSPNVTTFNDSRYTIRADRVLNEHRRGTGPTFYQIAWSPENPTVVRIRHKIPKRHSQNSIEEIAIKLSSKD